MSSFLEASNYIGGNIDDLIDELEQADISDSNLEYIKDGYEYCGNIIIERGYSNESTAGRIAFVESFRKRFPVEFKNNFLPKLLRKIFENIDDDLRQELDTKIAESESRPDRIAYKDLYISKKADFESAFHNYVALEGFTTENANDMKNYIETTVIVLSIVNTRLLHRKKAEDKTREEINESIEHTLTESSDIETFAVERLLTDPRMTTANYTVSELGLVDTLKLDTDPVDVNYPTLIHETRADLFKTDPDLRGEKHQIMHLIIKFEKLVGSIVDFDRDVFRRLKYEDISLVHKDMSDTIKIMSEIWDFRNSQMREDIDVRNIELVYGRAIERFDELARKLAAKNSNGKSHVKKFSDLELVIVPFKVENVNEYGITEIAHRFGIKLTDVEETFVYHTFNDPDIVSSKATVSNDFIPHVSILENPEKWEFEFEKISVDYSTFEEETQEADRAAMILRLEGDMK